MDATPKRSGALLRDAPAPQKLRLTQHNSGPGFAQGCTHPATVTERLPDTHLHYARLTCALCGCHLQWLPKPETLARQRVNAFNLEKLAMRPGLSDWEGNFTRDISHQPRLSPRQQEILDELVAKFLEANPS